MATACNAHGGTGRHDFESETFIAHTLKAEGADASEDGTGRGLPLVPIAFSSKDHGADAVDIAPTLRSCGHDKSHENGSGPPAIAFNIHSQNSCAMQGSGPSKAALETEVARALDSAGFTASQGGTLAFTERTRADGRNFECQEEVAYALTNPGSGGRTHSRQIAPAFGVRRLTPTECARLQGFPDDWLEGLGFSDSAKYKMLGNAVATPVAEFIALRLAAKLKQ